MLHLYGRAFFERIYYLEKFYVYNKIEREMQSFVLYPFLSQMYNFPVINTTHQNVHLLQ